MKRFFRRPWRFLRRAVADLELLLEGKLLFFLVADFLLVAYGLVLALVSSGKLPKIYQMAVILPMLILLVASLSAVIALERRAGSLDLALAAPDPTAFFLRRAIAPLLLVLVQGWGVLLLAYAERHPLADLLAGRLAGWEVMARAFFGSLLAAFLIAAVTLFWATRLRSGGAVAGATAGTLLFFLPFLMTSPELPPPQLFPKNVYEANAHLADWLWPMAVMTMATLLFFGAALDRLRRPELLS